ncbi:MAG: YqaJ viral recombinase family protein [Lentihominibacter sp.]
MRVLVKTKDMSREEWLNWRRKGIGGSDVSILFGVNSFKSINQLWLEKTGKTELEETDSEAAYFGHALESFIKKEFTRRTGMKVRAKNAILQSEEYPFMLADLDGVISLDGEMCIYEGKTASTYKKDIWQNDVPFEYVLQVQHYMAVTGAKRAFIAALVGGNTFFIREVLRDEVLIAKIIAVEKDFWEGHVLTGIEPLPDGSAASTEYLNARYAKTNGGRIELPPETLNLFRSYDEVTKEIENLNHVRDRITNQMKFYLQENEEGYVGDRRVSWKQIETSRFDRKRFEKDDPEAYQQYVTKSHYRRLLVA